MKLANMQRINVIDGTIEQLHSELQQLYQERSSLASDKPARTRKTSASGAISSINLDDIDLSLDDN